MHEVILTRAFDSHPDRPRETLATVPTRREDHPSARTRPARRTQLGGFHANRKRGVRAATRRLALLLPVSLDTPPVRHDRRSFGRSAALPGIGVSPENGFGLSPLTALTFDQTERRRPHPPPTFPSCCTATSFPMHRATRDLEAAASRSRDATRGTRRWSKPTLHERPSRTARVGLCNSKTNPTAAQNLSPPRNVQSP